MVPMSPLITVRIPVLVIPAVPPNVPKGSASFKSTKGVADGGVSASVSPVLKVQTSLTASALPARSVDAVVIVAVYKVSTVRLAFGVKVAFLFCGPKVTVPETGPPSLDSVKLSVLMVNGFMPSLKVALTKVLVGTLMSPSAGVTGTTVGAVVSSALPTVNCHG